MMDVLRPMIVEPKFWDEAGTFTIWELTSSGQRLDGALLNAEEFEAERVRKIVQAFYLQFSEIEKEVLRIFSDLPWDLSETDRINEAMNSPYADILITMLNGENYAPQIWELLKPGEENV